VRALCRQATLDLAGVPPGDRRQAFVLAGWGRLLDHADVQPCAFIVSNFFRATSEGEWLDTAMDEFTFSARLPSRSETPIVIAVPRAPSRPMVRVSRAVEDVAARGLGPTAIGRALEDGIRQVADTVRGVGRDVMVCSIPRCAVEAADASWSATPAGEPLSRTEIGSYYSTARKDVLIGGSNFVCRGMVTGRTRVTMGPGPSLTPEYIAQLARELGVTRARRR